MFGVLGGKRGTSKEITGCGESLCPYPGKLLDLHDDLYVKIPRLQYVCV
jgi:hypothetical protein